MDKADPERREAFIAPLQERLAATTAGKTRIVYLDEAHIHLDTDEGYGWTVKGERAWVSSSSPGLAKVSFFGVCLYNRAQVRLFPATKANGDATVEVLRQIRACFAAIGHITLIWDNASHHRSRQAKQAARELGITLMPLPPYSPDFMPVEQVWQWFREDVTYHACYDDESKLIAQAEALRRPSTQTPLSWRTAFGLKRP